MKVYIAAPYQSRDRIRAYAAELTRIGFTVTSTWLGETHEINEGTTGAATALPDEEVASHAYDDLRGVREADLFVLITESIAGHLGGGGRHVETGYFMAKHGPRHIVVVGDPENIFHRSKGVTVVPDWHEAVIELSARLVEDRRPRAAKEAL